MARTAGEHIGSNVQLLKPLGAGGMGEVWLGKHLTLHTEVAVKFVTEEYAQNPAIRQRFAREAAAAAKVKSPHIVQVFDHGFTPDDAPYIVMELLQGEELSDRLKRTGTVSLPELVAIVRQTCKGLSKAHQAGIVHRDIKPQNLFLTESDGDVFVKVLDFGIAKEADQVSSMTQTGAMLGTPYYMSPEQIQNSKDVDLRFDLWALAVLAYEALTGTKPFDGETIGAISFAIFEGSFPAPSTHVPGLPATIDNWFSRAFAKRPADRFQSAREFADAFVAAVPPDSRSMRPGPVNDEQTAEFPVISPKNMPSLDELAAQVQSQDAQSAPFDRTKILGGAGPAPTPVKNINGRTALSASEDDSSAAAIGLSATIDESVARPSGKLGNKGLVVLSAAFVAIGVAGTLVVLASKETTTKVSPSSTATATSTPATSLSAGSTATVATPPAVATTVTATAALASVPASSTKASGLATAAKPGVAAKPTVPHSTVTTVTTAAPTPTPTSTSKDRGF
jgi:eukaryotic-like serine/threonine-protein kinase